VSGAFHGRAAAGRAPSPARSQGEEHSAESASVLVDVGGGRGALVLYLDARFRDREIEISRAGSAQRVHTGVLHRHTASGAVLAAVFGSLAAAEYVVWRDAETPAASVVVTDGGVTEWTSHPPEEDGRSPMA
jgi:hypothetical protein